ncbi:hypothetical protein [Stenoxybacter acetivorans]|uniref:hypothetical protein n=1 Tax=Stenoxybacter acetivorans TaxID=422441 RepID=UPI00055B3729|nr:hypothetical protein [Stenoxybacter acetivorans]
MSEQFFKKKKGEIGEKLFAAWLDRNNYPYIYVRQSQKDFSAFLKKIGAKRPDFLVFLPGTGLIAVDVKNHTFSKSNGTRTVNISEDGELTAASQFSKLTKLHLWYAFVGSKSEEICDEWYFTYADEVPNKGKFRKGDNGIFYVLALEELCCVRDSLDGLSSYAKVSLFK